MIRFKQITSILSNNRFEHQSMICQKQGLFTQNRPPKTAKCFRPTSSFQFIFSIYYRMLICIMIASVISAQIGTRSSNSTVKDHLRFSRLIRATTQSLSILNELSSHPQHKVLNPQTTLFTPFTTTTTTEAISSVHNSFRRISLSPELNTDLFSPSSTLSLNQTAYYLKNKKAQNPNSRSLNIIKEEGFNLTAQIEPTSSPTLLKTSTPVSDDITEQVQSNTTYHSTKSEQHYSLAIQITISTILFLLIIATTVGNIFVIAAIYLDKNLQSAQNFLVLSLAVADLLVALLVMPPCMVYEVYQSWVLGSEMCVFWNLVDVFSCTASILHLLAIALDRYWSVSSLHYSQGRSRQRMMYTIMAIWLAAAVVSMPLLGVKDPEYEQRLQNGKCLMSQDVSYQIFATMSTFYVPSVIILFLYWKIYQVARKRIRNKPGNHAGSERKHRALSSKEEKSDSFKKANINTISSRVTMATSTVDVPTSSTQNTSSETGKECRQRESIKKDTQRSPKNQKHERNHSKSESNKELKQMKESYCQCDLMLKSNHRVYDSNALPTKSDTKFRAHNHLECDCDRDKKSSIDALRTTTHDDRPQSKRFVEDSKLIQQEQQLEEQTQSISSTQMNESTVHKNLKKSKRFQTKYKYIDEEERDSQLGNANEGDPNDRNNNIKCVNESRDKLNQLDKQIELNKQLESNLIRDSPSPLDEHNGLSNGLAGRTNLDSKLANSLGNGLIVANRSTDIDVHQMKYLNNELRQTNFELETQLNSSSNSNVNNSVVLNNQTPEQLHRRQINKSSSIQAIATTAIKAKNHSNTMAKKERKTAKILAIITGIFMICWLPFFINALLLALFPKTYQVSNILTSLFLWLGYFNSSLNPLVYTIFSPDFRNAFKKLLTRCKGS